MFNRETVLSCLAFYILTGFFNPAHAYIDPGTGSMLISVVLGASATLFFLFHTFIIKLKMTLFSKKDLSENNTPFVIYSEGGQYYSVFKPVIDEFERRKIPLCYLTSSKDDPVLGEKYDFVQSKFIGSKNKAYLHLAFLRADICLMTTPQLDVLQLRRSKFVKHYCHIFHSITFSMDYRLFSLDYYDSVLLDGAFQAPMIREIEEKRNLKKKDLSVSGSTYMDYLQGQIQALDIDRSNKPFCVLIAPSWGVDSLFQKFGEEFLDEIVKSGLDVIIRPHPQSMVVEKEFMDKMADKFKDCANVSFDFDSNNLGAMAKSDILISDFSSIMFDWAFLFNKPFIFSTSDMHKEIYDMSDLDETPYRYKIMREIGQEFKKGDNILSIIQNMRDKNKEYGAKINEFKQIAWEKQGLAAKNAVDFLVSKQKEITK